MLYCRAVKQLSSPSSEQHPRGRPPPGEMETKTTVRFPTNMLKEARIKAIDEGLSLSAVLRRLLRLWLRGKVALENERDSSQQVQLAREAFGMWSDRDPDEFLEKSVQLAIDGTAPELIKDILTTELAFMEDRHSMGQSILIAMGTFAPAFGMIGTLVGLVTMLVSLDDPSSIGGGMAIALLTTLYGAVMANLVFLPAA